MWTGLLVEKLLQTMSPLLNERVIEYPIIPSERKLPEKSFSWERGDDHLGQRSTHGNITTPKLSKGFFCHNLEWKTTNYKQRRRTTRSSNPSQLNFKWSVFRIPFKGYGLPREPEKHYRRSVLVWWNKHVTATALTLPSMAHLALSLQLCSEPLEVAVSPPYTRLLQLEDG